MRSGLVPNARGYIVLGVRDANSARGWEACSNLEQKPGMGAFLCGGGRAGRASGAACRRGTCTSVKHNLL